VSRQIILTPEAEADTQSAFDWYEEQDQGLGDQFLGCLEEALSLIARHPGRYPIRFDEIRRILIRRFPYTVYFDYDDGAVYIYYVFHSSQNPAKLRGRVRRGTA
jgi:plasmid stabilization system protein ParE